GQGGRERDKVRIPLLCGQARWQVVSRFELFRISQHFTSSKHLSSAILLLLLAAVSVRAGDDARAAGDLLQFVLPTTAAGLTLGYHDGEGALEFVESTALTLGVTYTLKYAVNERRPNGGSQSFPSGHASISFSSAEFMRKRYGWQYGLPAYAAASFVAYSRVESGEHSSSDVIAGAAVGIVSSYIFTKPYKGWWLQAESDGRFFGLRVTRKI